MVYKYAVFAIFPDRVSAQAAIVDLPEFGLGGVVVKLFEFSAQMSRATMLEGLKSNGTWAESDVRRGLKIGLGLGTVLGAVGGAVVWSVLDMSCFVGAVCGTVMGALIGSVTSGIVGSGLVNPRLARTLGELDAGQVLVSVSSRSVQEHERAVRLLRTGSLCVVSDRDGR